MHRRNQMTYQWPRWPQQNQQLAVQWDWHQQRCQCSFCKANDYFRRSCPIFKKEKEMDYKSGIKPHRQTNPPCETCEKKESSQRKERAHLRPKRPDQMTKPMIPKVMKEHPTRPRMQNRQLQANHFKEASIKKIILQYVTTCRCDSTSNQTLQ